MLWMILGTALSSIAPMSRPLYNYFCRPLVLVPLFVGYRTASQPRTSLLAASLATAKAGLLGDLPEFLILTLWAAGLVHPTVLNLDGSISIAGHGFTDFYFRLAKGVPVRIGENFIVLLILTLLSSMFLGFIGAIASKTIAAFRAAYHRA
jgi:hypothetical protein